MQVALWWIVSPRPDVHAMLLAILVDLLCFRTACRFRAKELATGRRRPLEGSSDAMPNPKAWPHHTGQHAHLLRRRLEGELIMIFAEGPIFTERRP